MTGVAEERARVGQHADERAERAARGKVGELGTHTVQIVVEPPCAALLDASDLSAALKTARDGNERGVVDGIQGIEDGLGQTVVLGKGVQQRRDVLHAGPAVDGIEAGVRAERGELRLVGVTQAAEMQLHHPAEVGVLFRTRDGDARLVGVHLLTGERLALHRLLEGAVCGLSVRLCEHAVIETVVCAQTAVGGEVVDARAQCCSDVVRAGERAAGDLAQTGDVGAEVRLFDVNCLVRAERRQHLDLHGRVVRDDLVPVQIVARVVGGAHRLDVEAAHQAARGGVPQHLAALVVDLVGIVRSERLMDAEHALELKMAPVVQRVADQARQDGGECAEFLTRVGIAGDEFLRDAVPAHLAPFVVVAAEPYFGDVVEPAVLGDLLRVDVAVVVDDGQLRRNIVVEMAGGRSRQQKICIHKRCHNDLPTLPSVFSSISQQPQRYMMPSARSYRP